MATTTVNHGIPSISRQLTAGRLVRCIANQVTRTEPGAAATHNSPPPLFCRDHEEIATMESAAMESKIKWNGPYPELCLTALWRHIPLPSSSLNSPSSET